MALKVKERLMDHRSVVRLAVGAALFAGPSPLLAQSPAVSYEVSFPNASHHEAEISATFPVVPAGAPLEVWMSRSSPGRYAVHEFAKNVYNMRAEDGAGHPLSTVPLTPYSWRIAGARSTVIVRYTLFGDRGDGTYAQIDRTHAHLNAPATFLWAKGLDARPVRLSFKGLPAGWRVATQLRPTSDATTFTAPNLQLFMDSPITVGPIDIRTWLVTNGARVDTMRLAIDHLGTAAEVDRYVEMIKRIVPEQAGVFGELAPYDWGTYTFLADYLPWASGDGMEHRNSTSLTGTRPLSTSMMGNFSTVAHEFFHSWNIERIRPRSLEPFDFTRANMSGELWLGEGFTNYYEELTRRRAGFSTDQEFAADLGGAVNAIVNSPGRGYFSAVDMSRQAPFVDAATSIDPQNRANTFISYYTFGEAIAPGLDLTLRARSRELSLDDFMRAMWVKYGKTERPYTMDDVRVTLGEVAHDQAFADDYVGRYIAGREVPDYGQLFASVGFLLRRARPGAAWLGDTGLSTTNGRVALATPTLVGQPIYAAGLERGDTLITVDGRPVASSLALDSIVSSHKPGDSVEVTFRNRGATIASRLVFAENPRMELVPGENAGVAVTALALERRRHWLASKAGTQGAPR
jgi:predicted metalloprotease with PDZ domain